MKYLIYIFLISCSFCFTETYQAKVTHVTDGDTIKVLYSGNTIKIRLNGIDTPEKKQAFGYTATKFVTEKCLNQLVTIDAKTKDRYGRTIADVYLSGNISLNRELVKGGYAWHYKRYSKDKELARLENEARSGNVGLWGDPLRVAPWDFRKGVRGKKVTAKNSAPRIYNTPFEMQKNADVYLNIDTRKFYDLNEFQPNQRYKILKNKSYIKVNDNWKDLAK